MTVRTLVRRQDLALVVVNIAVPRNEAEKKSLWELFNLKKDPQEMTNLASNPEYASMLVTLKDRFWKTRTFYADTDESVWGRGRRNRFRPEDYIRQRR